MNQRKKISIIVPMYNEEAVICETYKRLKTVLTKIDLKHELLFVDDGSHDDSVKKIAKISQNDTATKVIKLSRNFGHQNAVKAGLDTALGDAIVIIDADLQDPPEVICEMVKKWEMGFDVVYGKRKERDGESVFKKLSASLFYKFFNSMASIKIPQDTGDFRLIDKKVNNAIKQFKEKKIFLRGMIPWLGFSQTEVLFHREKRFAGTTKYPLNKMLRFAMDGIFSFSDKPIKLLQTGIIIYFLISILPYSHSMLWLNNSIWLFTMITILEYISRFYDELRDRPIYIINEKLSSNLEKIRFIKKYSVRTNNYLSLLNTKNKTDFIKDMNELNVRTDT